jgi:hypothetical protein
MSYLSVRAFSREIGVDAKTVREAIEKGRLIEALHTDEKTGWIQVDSEIGKKEWEENRDPAATLAMQLNGNSVEQDELSTEDSALMNDSGSVKDETSFAARRAVREYWAGKIAQLNYEEKAATLIEAKTVRKLAFDLGRKMRDSMINIPDRVAVELAAETDHNKIHARLMEEIEIALRTVADA